MVKFMGMPLLNLLCTQVHTWPTSVLVWQYCMTSREPRIQTDLFCTNFSKQHLPASTHPLLIKCTWLMAQLLAKHFTYKCHFVQPKVGESSTFSQRNAYKHAAFIHKQQLQLSVLSDMFSEMLLWTLHPPFLRNQSVKTCVKRWCCNLKTLSHQQFCFEYDTKQKSLLACL